MNKLFRTLSLMLLASALPAMAAPEAGTCSNADSDVVIKAMKDEIARSMKGLQVPGKPKPYFLRYEVNDQHAHTVSYELGVKAYEDDQKTRNANADVRLGSYEHDNSFSKSKSKRRLDYRAMPIENDYVALRHQLWLLTDNAYKQAAPKLDEAQAYKLGHDVRRSCESLSREKPNSTVLPLVPEQSWSAECENRVKDLSRIFKEFPNIRSSYITLYHVCGTSRVVNSEGTVSRDSGTVAAQIGFVAYSRTPDGVDTWDCDYVSVDDEKDLPSREELEARVRKFAENLSTECTANRLDYYYGPVLFEPTAASEVVLHGIAPLLCAVPGDNIDPSGTLLRSLNQRVLPELLTIVDDPTLKSFDGRFVAGHHDMVDSDGIPPSKVTLIDHGFLRNFLCGRTPIFPGQKSNGHNISNESTPTTLVVTAHQTLNGQQMRQKLMSLAKERGLKEAIIVRRIVPNTSLFLNGSPTDTRSDNLDNRLVEIYTLDVETGKEKRVRGLRLDGFTRANMDNIVCAGDEVKPCVTANWRGQIRTIIAPSLLVENMELEEDAGDSWASYPVSAPN